MKILVYSAYPGFTGSHRIALQIATACRDADHEITVAAPEEMEILARASAEGLKTAILPFPADALPFGKALLSRSTLSKLWTVVTKLLPYNLRVRRFIRSGEFDVVYAAQERAIILMGLGARLAHVPLLWHIQGGLLSGSGQIYRVIDWLANKRVCVSSAVADTVVEVLGEQSRNRLQVIHNGVPDVNENMTRPIESVGENAPFRVFFAGSIIPEKGVHHLIAAVGELQSRGLPVLLKIAGHPLDEGYLAHLKKLIGQHALSGKAELLGTRDDIPALLDWSDVVVCPSVEKEFLDSPFGKWEVDWKEGFCLVALEGMRAFRAVVASDSYGLKEVVDDKVTGERLAPGNYLLLADTLENLAKDEKKMIQYGENGRKRFEELFTMRLMTDQFLTVFEEMGSRDTG